MVAGGAAVGVIGGVAAGVIVGVVVPVVLVVGVVVFVPDGWDTRDGAVMFAKSAGDKRFIVAKYSCAPFWSVPAGTSNKEKVPSDGCVSMYVSCGSALLPPRNNSVKHSPPFGAGMSSILLSVTATTPIEV